MRKGSYLATCRYCGAQGTQDETDPAPDICPDCFEKRLAKASEKITPETTQAEARALLIDVGVTPEWADRYLDLLTIREAFFGVWDMGND